MSQSETTPNETTSEFTMADAQSIISTTDDQSFNVVPVINGISFPVQSRFVPEAWEGLGDAFIEEIQGRYLKAATSGSAGIDLRYVGGTTITLYPGDQVMVSTGLAIWLRQPNYVGLAVPRSGRGMEGLVLGNLIGIIDSDYQNEIKLCMWNRGDNPVHIEPGERVAQYFAIERLPLQLVMVNEFDEETERGLNGFGSSGKW